MDPAALLLALQLALAPCEPAGVDDIYTRSAHRAVTLYWAPARRYLWCALVAQAGAESDWRAGAVSPAGAEGPWQIMPGTWIEHTARHGWEASPFDPWVSSQVAAIHMEGLARIWSAPRSDWRRMELQVASYNAGQGHVIAAQRLAGGACCWEEIAPHLPAVTGRHAAETRGYVARWKRILAGLWGRAEIPLS